MTERYPLDFDALNPGDTITEREIVRVKPGLSPEHKDFRLEVLKLCTQIEDHLQARLGHAVRAVQVKGDIRILLPGEHLNYEIKRRKQQRRAFGRSVRSQAGIPRELLTAEEQALHDREIQRAAFQYQQLLKPAPKAFPKARQSRSIEAG